MDIVRPVFTPPEQYGVQPSRTAAVAGSAVENLARSRAQPLPPTHRERGTWSSQLASSDDFGTSDAHVRFYKCVLECKACSLCRVLSAPCSCSCS